MPANRMRWATADESCGARSLQCASFEHNCWPAEGPSRVSAGLSQAPLGLDRHADNGVSQIFEAPVLRTAWAQFARQAMIRTCSTAREQKGRAAAVDCRMLWGWSTQVVGGAGVLVSWWVEGLEHPGGRWRLVSCVGVRAPCCVHQACSVI
jgi:hypothetical protein